MTTSVPSTAMTNQPAAVLPRVNYTAQPADRRERYGAITAAVAPITSLLLNI